MKPAAIPTFVQNSRIHRTIYQIRDRELAISNIRPGGGFREFLVDLRSIDPDYQPRAVRLHRLLIVPGAMALLSALVIWGLMQLTFIPHEALLHFLHWPAIIFAVSLALAIQGSRRVEYYLFLNHWKKPAFEIICEREQRDECASFMSALVAHIELAQSGVDETERAKILAGLDQMAGSPPDQAPAGNKWKYSIGLGLAGVVLALFALAGTEPDPSLLILIFPLCLGGMALSYFSFHAREPRRWWSLLGAVLSLIPPFLS